MVHGFDNGNGTAGGMSGTVTVMTQTGASRPASSTSSIGTDDNVYTRLLDASGNPSGGYYRPERRQVQRPRRDPVRTSLASGFEAFVIGTDNQVYAQTIDPATTSAAISHRLRLGRVDRGGDRRRRQPTPVRRRHRQPTL